MSNSLPETAHTSADLDPLRLQPGDTYIRKGHGVPPDPAGDVTVEILGPAEPYEDMFGLAMTRYWAMRHDTHACGYVMFGDGAAPLSSPGGAA